MDIDDHLEGSNGTGVLIPQAQIMEVLHNLNVSALIIIIMTISDRYLACLDARGNFLG